MDCPADYFDGHQAVARPVRLRVVQGLLSIEGPGVALQVPVQQVAWPEVQRHGVRLAYLPGQGMLSCRDTATWDRWARQSGLSQPMAAVWAHSWRRALLALLATVALLGAAYRWGTPWAAETLLALCPPTLDEQVGAVVLEGLERELLRPSRLPSATQAALRQRFDQAVRRAHPGGGLPSWTLHFRDSVDALGANAFALPGGHIVVTDAMVRLLADRPDALIGVMGHELGHVRHRHGMRGVVQAGVLAALSSVVLGDFSAVLTAAPAMLGQLAYSREFELQADDEAAALMRANGLDPAALAVLFERLRAAQGPGTAALPIALSTHPPDDERVRRLRRSD
ncbi:M48 family metallopeptidase [Ideonella sp. A 288]|uniref:M48 family metallopeptidase n=1 Tax=Ideonella sp. A 288 TaxID=1962181 RepID=UPI000B4A81A8|nr:M48 family metallopeptidase [Ideonella sp. A 288]